MFIFAVKFVKVIFMFDFGGFISLEGSARRFSFNVVMSMAAIGDRRRRFLTAALDIVDSMTCP